MPHENSTVGKKHSATRGSHTGYTPDQRQSEDIGKYATENGPTRATRHF